MSDFSEVPHKSWLLKDNRFKEFIDGVQSLLDFAEANFLEVGDGVFEVLSTSGDRHLGGDDFDKRVVDGLAANFKRDEGIDLLKDNPDLQRLTETAEKAKMELSSFTQTNISLPFITATADGPKHIESTITRDKFGELCSDLLDRVKSPVDNACTKGSQTCLQRSG